MAELSISASPSSSTIVGTPQRIIGAILSPSRKVDHWPMLKRQSVYSHRNRDLADKGGVVLADQVRFEQSFVAAFPSLFLPRLDGSLT
jgi:hypothetical protein